MHNQLKADEVFKYIYIIQAQSISFEKPFDGLAQFQAYGGNTT